MFNENYERLLPKKAKINIPAIVVFTQIRSFLKGRIEAVMLRMSPKRHDLPLEAPEQCDSKQMQYFYLNEETFGAKRLVG